MASSKEYLQFILEQLSDLEEINYRAMMGEYIIYYRGRIVGGIYDDRLLVKPTKSAVSYMATAIYELPYEGAKEMLLVEDVDSKLYLILVVLIREHRQYMIFSIFMVQGRKLILQMMNSIKFLKRLLLILN